MCIDMDEEKAKEILSDIGYFRLGSYCFPFEMGYPNKKNRTHQYREGTKFSDVIKLYYLDVDLHYMLEQLSKNRANEMKNEINQLFDKFGNSMIISDIIESLIGRRCF